MRRKVKKMIPVRSTLLSVVLILSAVLFISLALVSCRSESDTRRAELPQRPPNQAEPIMINAPPASIAPAAVTGRVEGFVAGGVAGGVIGTATVDDGPALHTEEYGRF